jgi:hypothetical protein
MSLHPLIAIGLALVVALGCRPPPAMVLDGYPVDGLDACTEHDCSKLVAHAGVWLDATEPGHPAIAGFEGHRVKIDRDGVRILLTRSGGGLELVIVLHLADGSSRARYIWCGAGIDPDRCGDLSADELRAMYDGT